MIGPRDDFARPIESTRVCIASPMSGESTGDLLKRTRQQGNDLMAWRRLKLENEPTIDG